MLQAIINRFQREANDPKPFTWRTHPDKIIAHGKARALKC